MPSIIFIFIFSLIFNKIDRMYKILDSCYFLRDLT